MAAVGQDTAAAEFVLRGMAATDPAAVPTVATASARAAPVTPTASASEGSTDEAAAQPDAYRKHRRGANQLTRHWRKSIHAASVAYGAGDHAGGPLPYARVRNSKVSAWVCMPLRQFMLHLIETAVVLFTAPAFTYYS